MGAAQGFDALVELLAVTDDLGGSDPPEPVWSVALSILQGATGETGLGPSSGTAGELRQAQARWRSWLEDRGASLSFDQQSRTWSAA